MTDVPYRSPTVNEPCCVVCRKDPHGKQASQHLALRKNRREVEVRQAYVRQESQNQTRGRHVLRPMAQRQENGMASMPQSGGRRARVQATRSEAHCGGVWHRGTPEEHTRYTRRYITSAADGGHSSAVARRIQTQSSSRVPCAHEADDRRICQGVKKTTIATITRVDLLRFKQHLIDKGRSERTAANKCLRINQFLRNVLKLDPGKRTHHGEGHEVHRTGSQRVQRR